jgi:hypothetical protein
MPRSKKPILILAPRTSSAGTELSIVAEVCGPQTGHISFKVTGDCQQEAAQNDAFVLPAYLHALHHGHDVHFDFPVSHRLVANLNDAIGPLLLAFAPDLFPHPIVATAREFLWGSSNDERPSGSATGMSCGLDSFSTVRYAQGFPNTSRRRLAAVAHFDVGNHSPLGGEDEALYAQRRARAAIVAAELGMPLFDVRSNLGEWVPGGFARLHTLRNAAAAYLLYPSVGTYIYANGVRISDTCLSARDSAYIDALLLPLLSTSYIEFIQGTPAWGAPEKTKSILDDSVAQAHLNVCYFQGRNCGICEKCLRRALLIDSYGRLADFSKVFDTGLFRENRDWYIGYVMMRASSSPVMHELLEHLKLSNYLSRSTFGYHCAWLKRRAENWVLKLLGRSRRPL